MKIINPATEGIAGEVQEDSRETVESKFKMLRDAQRQWQALETAERVRCVRKFAGLLGEQIEPLSRLLTTEAGKPLQQSRNEINGAIRRINWLADHADKAFSGEIMSREEGLVERITYEPLGVVCNISAWNYPYLVGVNVFIPALLAGNTVLYKPSEYATLTGLEIEKLLHRSGVPPSVFVTAAGGREVGEMLLDLSFDGYFFTGSYATGQAIYKKVAPRMVPCQCELGGKDPLYVAGDIEDIQAVAAATADGAFYNNGQSCCAVERVYVHEHVYDRFVDAFVQTVRAFKLGDPLEEGTYLGPLTRKSQLDVLGSQVDEAVAMGATVLTGGKVVSRQGYYFEPTVLVGVTHEMSIMREESFGPVIGIMKVGSDAEAVSLMNDTPYGLTAAVYTASQQRAEAILRQIDAGTGYWNCCDRVSAALPWSGRKHSGFGVTLSHAGLRSFVRPKAWHLRTGS